MLFTLSRLSYLGLSLSFGWLSWRFWNNYRKEKDTISENFSNFQFFLAIGTFLFFLETFVPISDFVFKEWLWIAGLFFVNTGFSFAGYLVFYLRFPKIPPAFGFRVFFIWGTAIMFSTVVLPIRFFVFPDGQIELFLPPLTAIMTFGLILVTSLPLGIIIIKQALTLKSQKERIKSLSLGVTCLAGVTAALFFTLISTLELRLILSIIMVLGVIFLSRFVTQGKIPEVK